VLPAGGGGRGISPEAPVGRGGTSGARGPFGPGCGRALSGRPGSGVIGSAFGGGPSSGPAASGVGNMPLNGPEGSSGTSAGPPPRPPSAASPPIGESRSPEA